MKIAMTRFEPTSWLPPAQQASSQDHWTMLPLKKSLFLAKWVNNLAKIHITHESHSKVHIETQVRVIYIFNINLDFQLVVCHWLYMISSGIEVSQQQVSHWVYYNVLFMKSRHCYSFSVKKNFTVGESPPILLMQMQGTANCTTLSARDFATVCETLNITKCQPYVLQMWWNKLKYSFYRQNPAYLPQIYCRFFDKHGFTSFKQHLPEKFHWGKM